MVLCYFSLKFILVIFSMFPTLLIYSIFPDKIGSDYYVALVCNKMTLGWWVRGCLVIIFLINLYLILVISNQTLTYINFNP